MHKLRTLAVVASLLFAVAAQAQSPVVAQKAEALTQTQIEGSTDTRSLMRLATLYQRLGDKDRYRASLKRLTELVPGSMHLKLTLAASYAADDMKTPAYDVLLKMKGAGFGVDLAKDPRFGKIHGTQVWDFIVKSLKANLAPFGKGKVAWKLPAADLLVDALAWDPGTNQLLAGSARDGGVYRIDDGRLKPFIKADANNQLWSVMAMATDAKHHRLWVATTSTVYFKGYAPENAGKAALVEFDLRSGKLLHRYPLDVAGTGYLSSLALAPDGTVYVADGVNKVVYRVAGGKLKQVLANPKLNDIHAIAISGDGKTLYLADSVYGVFGYDLASHKGFGLRYNPDGLVLPGIVGMYWYDGTLVVIEPGMHPQRVMRVTLSKDGKSVTKAMPLDVAHPEFSLLDQGVVAGDKLYLIANNQRAKYDDYGMLRAGEVLEPLTIWQSNLRFAWNEGGVNIGLHRIPSANKAKKPASGLTKPGANKPAPIPSWIKSH